MLRDVPPSVGAPVFASVLLITAVVMLAMAGRPSVWTNRAGRALLLGYGWLVAMALLVAVPDAGVLALVGYAPMLLAGAPFGWPPDVDYSDAFSWPLLNQVFALIGGFLVVGAVLAWQRRTAAACVSCGRGVRTASWSTPDSARRWGKWAVAIASAVPALYAVSRIAWAFDVPMFVDDEFLRELHAEDGHLLGAGLAAFALVGVVLTLGLVQRWGETFPRWMIGMGGERVPLKLAVIPGLLVATLVTSAGVGIIVQPEAWEKLGAGDWLVLPQLMWPLWGAALAAATFAYYFRRRSTCAQCGRGSGATPAMLS